MAKSTAPNSLQKDGRALWDSLIGTVSIDDARVRHELLQACAIEDDIARYRAELAKSSLLVVGSTGQQVVNPLIAAISVATSLQRKLLEPPRPTRIVRRRL
jgi:hypothetical protein